MNLTVSALIALACLASAPALAASSPLAKSGPPKTIMPPAVWYIRFGAGETNVPIHLRDMVAGAPSRKWGLGPLAFVLCHEPKDQVDWPLRKDRLTAVEALLRASGADAVYVGSRMLCEHSARPHAPKGTLEIHRLASAVNAQKKRGASLSTRAPSRKP